MFLLLRNFSEDDVDDSENFIWKCLSRFCNQFSIIQTCLKNVFKLFWCYRMWCKVLVFNWDRRLRDNRQNWTFVIFSQVISRRGKNENVCEMSKNEKCTCKVCKTIAFHLPNMQVCNTDKFLIFSSNRCYIFSSMIIGTQFSSITSWNYCRNTKLYF